MTDMGARSEAAGSRRRFVPSSSRTSGRARIGTRRVKLTRRVPAATIAISGIGASEQVSWSSRREYNVNLPSGAADRALQVRGSVVSSRDFYMPAYEFGFGVSRMEKPVTNACIVSESVFDETPMNFDAPEEHGLLRQNVRRFFAEELPESTIREMDQARKVPKTLWKRFAELGWMGLSIPLEYGGSGADLTTGIVLCEELSRQFPSLGSDYVIFSMAARAIREHGTEKQKETLLPRMARGEFMFAFGITEPSGGTDVLALKTRAQLVGGEWVINGQKLYTTFADDADAILVVCRTDPPEEGKRARGLSLILAPRHQPGFTIRRLNLMACRAACTCETFIEDVRAPSDGLLGERGRGWYHLLATLDEERILTASIYVGIMDGVLAQALQYANDRTAYGRPIGAFQAVQHPIAEIATDLEHSRTMVTKAAWLLANGRECSKEAAMAKLFASEAAVRATNRGMRVLAGYGLVEESPMERLFRDARLGPFSPISNEMARNFIGQRLGLPRSY